jgi:Zn-dependent peptidase ImmA (M78 family)/transcriptional regulator with XRE-family HTH domain
MAKGINTFRAERLTQAREARGLSGVALDGLSGIGDVNISKYENGHAYPPADRLETLAKVLRVPVSFFMRPFPKPDSGPLFWRSLHVAEKPARTRAIRKFEWAKEISDFVQDFLEFPRVNLPPIERLSDFHKIHFHFIEEAAATCRAFWNVEKGPLPNVIRLLEQNGIVVVKTALDADNLDAFSQIRDDGRPYVFLGSDKGSAVRSRFDALHEVGHLILHLNVDSKTFNTPQNWKVLENQAHHFACAMLLPADQFISDLGASPNLDAFRGLKAKWKAAMGAMIHRCKSLEIISEEQARRMWMNMTRRGWRQREPLDDVIQPEEPRLLAQSIAMLVDNGVRSKSEIPESLGFSDSDITDLSALPNGYFDSTFGEITALPKMKPDFSPPTPHGDGPKVISFPNAFRQRE